MILIINLLSTSNDIFSFSIDPDSYKQDPSYSQTKSHENVSHGYKQPLRPLDSNTSLSGHHQGYHHPPDPGPGHALAEANIKTEQPDFNKHYNYNSRRWVTTTGCFITFGIPCKRTHCTQETDRQISLQ